MISAMSNAKNTPDPVIPISPLLNDIENSPVEHPNNGALKKRLLLISGLSIAVALVVSIIARLLVWLINIITNISFYGTFSTSFHSPSANHLGVWVIIIPAIGGIIVGLMALYGSAAI